MSNPFNFCQMSDLQKGPEVYDLCPASRSKVDVNTGESGASTIIKDIGTKVMNFKGPNVDMG